MKKIMRGLGIILVCFMPLSYADYPDKTIKIVVGYPPGGAADNTARLFAEGLSKELNQTVVIENKPGAGATISSSILARSKPDGYTLGIGTANTMGVDRILNHAKYTAEDFVPITQIVSAPLILIANNDLNVDNVRDLKEEAQKNPEKFTYSSSGIGGSPHIAGLMFSNAIDQELLHVPFKGGSDSVNAVASGEISFSFGTAGSVLPLGKAGKYKMLGVSSETKSEIAPELPSLNESGLDGFVYEFWFGLFGPKGLPEDVADTLFEASKKALQDKSIKEKLLTSGNLVQPSESREAFEQFAHEMGEKSLKRLKEADLD